MKKLSDLTDIEIAEILSDEDVIRMVFFSSQATWFLEHSKKAGVYVFENHEEIIFIKKTLSSAIKELRILDKVLKLYYSQEDTFA